MKAESREPRAESRELARDCEGTGLPSFLAAIEWAGRLEKSVRLRRCRPCDIVYLVDRHKAKESPRCPECRSLLYVSAQFAHPRGGFRLYPGLVVAA